VSFTWQNCNMPNYPINGLHKYSGATIPGSTKRSIITHCVRSSLQTSVNCVHFFKCNMSFNLMQNHSQNAVVESRNHTSWWAERRTQALQTSNCQSGRSYTLSSDYYIFFDISKMYEDMSLLLMGHRGVHLPSQHNGYSWDRIQSVLLETWILQLTYQKSMPAWVLKNR
jgi:hypothetical protein